MGVVTIFYHATWIRKSTVSVVIVAFMADDLIDGIATLLFAANTFYRTLAGVPRDEINDVNPTAAVVLRLVIFTSSFAALYIANKAGRKQLDKEVAYEKAACQIRDRLAAGDGAT